MSCGSERTQIAFQALAVNKRHADVSQTRIRPAGIEPAAFGSGGHADDSDGR
jgi:hypothetical protein